MKTLTILLTFCLVAISSYAVESPSWIFPYQDWNYYSPGTQNMTFRFQSNENNSRVFFHVEQKTSDNNWNLYPGSAQNVSVNNQHDHHSLSFDLGSCLLANQFRAVIVTRKNWSFILSAPVYRYFKSDYLELSSPNSHVAVQEQCSEAPWDVEMPKATTAKYNGGVDFSFGLLNDFSGNTKYYHSVGTNGELKNYIMAKVGTDGFSPNDVSAWNSTRKKEGGVFYYEVESSCKPIYEASEEELYDYGRMAFFRIKFPGLSEIDNGLLVDPEDLICPDQMSCSMPGITYYLIPEPHTFGLNYSQIKEVNYYYIGAKNIRYKNVRMTNGGTISTPFGNIINKKICFDHLKKNGIASRNYYEVDYIMEVERPSIDDHTQYVTTECTITRRFYVDPTDLLGIPEAVRAQYYLIERYVDYLQALIFVSRDVACELAFMPLMLDLNDNSELSLKIISQNNINENDFRLIMLLDDRIVKNTNIQYNWKLNGEIVSNQLNISPENYEEIGEYYLEIISDGFLLYNKCVLKIIEPKDKIIKLDKLLPLEDVKSLWNLCTYKYESIDQLRKIRKNLFTDTNSIVLKSNKLSAFNFEANETNTASFNEVIRETANKITIFPNPNTGKFKVKFTGETPELIKIYDYQGKVLHSSEDVNEIQNHELIIDQFDLSNGVYFISAMYKDGSYKSEKIIIKK
jgi:hypothetical protein